MTDSTPLTPAEREELNELAQELRARLSWGPHAAAGLNLTEASCKLLARALDELARLQLEVETLRRDTTDDDAVHGWFELTYSNYFAVQRTVLQSMPPEWQRKFVALLNEVPDTLDLTGVPQLFKVHAVDESGHYVRDHFSDYERGRRQLPRKQPPP